MSLYLCSHSSQKCIRIPNIEWVNLRDLIRLAVVSAGLGITKIGLEAWSWASWADGDIFMRGFCRGISFDSSSLVFLECDRRFAAKASAAKARLHHRFMSLEISTVTTNEYSITVGYSCRRQLVFLRLGSLCWITFRLYSDKIWYVHANIFRQTRLIS